MNLRKPKMKMQTTVHKKVALYDDTNFRQLINIATSGAIDCASSEKESLSKVFSQLGVTQLRHVFSTFIIVVDVIDVPAVVNTLPGSVSVCDINNVEKSIILVTASHEDYILLKQKKHVAVVKEIVDEIQRMIP